MTARNLVLIHRGPEYEQDFDEIAQLVNAADKNITVYHLPARLDAELPVSAWQYPTLTVSLSSRFRLPVRRGPIIKSGAIQKLIQQDVFRRNGIPTPPALPFKFGMKLDPIVFGEFVVLKPMDLRLTSTGENIHLFRRRRAEQITPAHFTVNHPLRNAPGSYLVQRFVDTGEHISYNRVMSFLGTPLYCMESTAITPRPALDSSDELLETARIANLGVGEKRPYRFHVDLDVLAIARRVHNALPHIPLLGIDIIREKATRRLFVLECNAGGNGWHFSSEAGRDLRTKAGRFAGYRDDEAERGGRRVLIEQLGAFSLAAATLVKHVHRLAE